MVALVAQLRCDGAPPGWGTINVGEDNGSHDPLSSALFLLPVTEGGLPQWFYVLSLGSQKKLHDSFIFLNDNTKVAPVVHKRKLSGEIYPLLSTP